MIRFLAYTLSLVFYHCQVRSHARRKCDTFHVLAKASPTRPRGFAQHRYPAALPGLGRVRKSSGVRSDTLTLYLFRL